MLSFKARYCLKRLAASPCSTWDVARQAHGRGINNTICRYEWADEPFRSLRNAGLIRKTARRDRMRRSIHEITEEGRRALHATEDAA